MSKLTLLFSSLIIILVVLAVYLIVNSGPDIQPEPINGKPLDQQDGREGISEIQDPTILETAYRQELKLIYGQYLRSLNYDGLEAQSVSQYKNQLLALKVPTKYKELHLDLVLALTKMEDYLRDGDEAKKIESDNLISQINSQSPWLTAEN